VNKTASVTVTPAASAPAYVQGSAVLNDAGAFTIARAFTTANTAGNLIVAAVSWDSTATLTCSDSQGNAYVVVTTQYDATWDQSLAVCYAVNIKAGANTVTASFGSSVTTRRLAVHEYSGIALTSPVDVSAKRVGTGTTTVNGVSSPAATTTASGDLIFGAVMDVSGSTTSITAGTGFTQRQSLNNKDFATEDTVQAAAGSIAATQTFGASHRYIALMVAFRRK
jgi:hypothetical protein